VVRTSRRTTHDGRRFLTRGAMPSNGPGQRELADVLIVDLLQGVATLIHCKGTFVISCTGCCRYV